MVIDMKMNFINKKKIITLKIYVNNIFEAKFLLKSEKIKIA
jgi:hypothetical protein